MLYVVVITGKMTTNVAAETTDVEVVKGSVKKHLENSRIISNKLALM